MQKRDKDMQNLKPLLDPIDATSDDKLKLKTNKVVSSQSPKQVHLSLPIHKQMSHPSPELNLGALGSGAIQTPGPNNWNSLDDYFWNAEKTFSVPQTIKFTESEMAQDICADQIKMKLQQIHKKNTLLQQPNYADVEAFESACSLSKQVADSHSHDAQSLQTPQSPENAKAAARMHHLQSVPHDAKKLLKFLGKEHESRDALNMLLKSQVEVLEKKYLPSIADYTELNPVQHDMFLCNKFACALERVQVNNKDQKSCTYDVELQQIGLSKLLDYQYMDQTNGTLNVKQTQKITLLEFSYQSETAFQMFTKAFADVYHPNLTKEEGTMYPVTSYQEFLYFWKTERHIIEMKDYFTQKPQNGITKAINLNMSKDNSGKSLIPANGASDPLIKLLNTLKEGDSQSKGSETIFRLFKVNMLQPEADPIEIKDRSLLVPDTPDGKMAISIGFIRNQSQKTYLNLIDGNQELMNEEQFLDSQYVCLKHVPTCPDEFAHNSSSSSSTFKVHKFDLTIRSLSQINAVLNTATQVNIQDQFFVLLAQSSEVASEESQSQAYRGKATAVASTGYRAQVKVQKEVNMILSAIRKRFSDSLRQFNLRMTNKMALVFVLNNQVDAVHDIVYAKAQRTKQIGSGRGTQDLGQVQIKLKKNNAFSSDLAEQFLLKAMNNSFVLLFDSEKQSYFFKRCEPITVHPTKHFIIKNAIFNKITALMYREVQNRGSFSYCSTNLKNYGVLLQNVPIQKLVRDFPIFGQQWTEQNSFSAKIANFFKGIRAIDQNKQLIISKNYSNLARMEDNLILFLDSDVRNSISGARTEVSNSIYLNGYIEIPDKFDTKVPQLNQMHLTYISNRKINGIREKRRRNKYGDIAVLTLLPENKTDNPHQDWAGAMTVQLDALEGHKMSQYQTDVHNQHSHRSHIGDGGAASQDGHTHRSENLHGHYHIGGHGDGHGHSHNFYQSEKNIGFLMDHNDGLLHIKQGDNMKSSDIRSEQLIELYLKEMIDKQAQEEQEMAWNAAQNNEQNLSMLQVQHNIIKSYLYNPVKDSAKKLKTSWRFIYEKVRFSEDDRSQRPLIVYRMLKNERQKLLNIKFWLVVFDFAEQVILQQEPLFFPELDLTYEPKSICLAASSEPVRICDMRLDQRADIYSGEQKQCIYFAQNFQVSFSLEHQKRVKICEFKIEWGETSVDQQDYYSFFVNQVQIHYCGLKELIISKTSEGRSEEEFKPELLPLFDNQNNICGTQLAFYDENKPMIFHFCNEIEESQDLVANNQLLEKAGYLLYRSNTSFEMEAVLAYSSLKLFLLKDRETTKMTSKDTIHILEQSVKIILNSVVLDPMMPVFRSESIPFFQEYSLGLGFESLNWFSAISVKGISQELDLLFPSEKEVSLRRFNECCSELERKRGSVFTPLIQRVLADDFHKFGKEGIVNYEKCDMNFNRIETLVKDRLLFRHHDIIQRDIYFKSAVHYLLDQDVEIDFLLESVFKSFDQGNKLPESEEIFKSMLVKFLEREEPLKLFHRKFMAPEVIKHETIKSDSNEQSGQIMKFAQKIRGKYIPKKQASPLQIFPSLIPLALDNFSSENIVQRQLESEDLRSGIDYQIETFFIDLRLPFLDNKIEWTINQIIAPQDTEPLVHGFTQYDLANLVNNIQRNRAVNFDEDYLLKNLIDYQWVDTQWWQKKFFLIYFFFYLVPFFFQIFQEDERIVVVCNCSCMLTIIWCCVYEYLQYLHADSFADYIEDFWNKNDFAHVCTYGGLYFFLRITRPGDSIINFFEFEKTNKPWDDNYFRMYAVKCVLTTTNITLCAQAVMKMLNYLRIFERFGLFILLVGQVLTDLSFFFLFMFLWLIVFTVMLFILGVGVPNPEDYPHCPDFLMLILQVWRNSLGDIQPPEYEAYVQKYNAMTEYKSTHGFEYASVTPVNILVSLIWIVWLLNCIFNQIIMLNFMISIIQASYDKVLNKENSMMYRYKCDLNCEVQIFKSYFTRWIGEPPSFNSLIILTAGDSEEDEKDQVGFMHMVRGLTSKILQVQKKHQDDSGYKIRNFQEVQADMQSFVDGVHKSNTEMIKNEMSAINIQLEDLSTQISSISEDISEVYEKTVSIPQVEEVSDNIDQLEVVRSNIGSPIGLQPFKSSLVIESKHDQL